MVTFRSAQFGTVIRVDGPFRVSQDNLKRIAIDYAIGRKDVSEVMAYGEPEDIREELRRIYEALQEGVEFIEVNFKETQT